MPYGSSIPKGYGADDGEMRRLFKHSGWEDIDSVVYGEDDHGLDCKFFGATSGKYALWDESADTFYLTCTVDIDGTVTVGVDDTGYDVKFFGATSGAYFEYDESADRANIVRTSAAITGTLRSLNISQTMTGASTANVVEALYVKVTADVKTGAWANAIVGAIDYSTSGAAHGMAAAICAELTLPNSSLARGALYCFDMYMSIGASSSWASAGPVAFMKFEAGGTVAQLLTNGYLFHVAGVTAENNGLFDDSSSAIANAILKIRVGTTDYFILLSTSA